MTSAVHRRGFLAASTLAIPAIALGSISNTKSLDSGDSEFDNYMKQANQHLKSLRTPMRTLTEDWHWGDSAFAANQIAILLLQSAEVASQAPIPERHKEKYKGKDSEFERDLRLQLADGAATCIALSKALWSKDREVAMEKYNNLRSIKKLGHEEFTED
ncbi:MAG: hypothetical protein P1U42_06555 [Phycisphaerales bacterium]|jgi:hypothetical protein|nr:hypothetical protein [Phycisphaerales bacterium]